MSIFNTIIVSDVHLGSEVSRTEELLGVLKQHSFKRLILLGDIFEDIDLLKLQERHWKLLSYIRDLASSGVKIVWIEGNHDSGLSDVILQTVGVGVLQEYSWQEREKKYLAIHGHQFDNFIVDHSLITNIATNAYRFLQKIDSEQRLSRFAKRMSKRWLQQSKLIALKATEYARAFGADYVFCGHTHMAMNVEIDEVEYFNTGCWTDIPSTFIGITDESVEIHEHY